MTDIMICQYFGYSFFNFLRITLLNRNTKLTLALAFPTDAPITVANEARENPMLASDRTSKVLSAHSSAVIYLLF